MLNTMILLLNNINSMTTKININATNLPFVPGVDNINEESNMNDKNFIWFGYTRVERASSLFPLWDNNIFNVHDHMYI